MKSLPRLMSALVIFSATHVMAAELPTVEVYKTLSCGCCGFWVEHMQKSGFKVNVHNVRDVTPMRGIVLGGGAQQLQVKVTVTPLG